MLCLKAGEQPLEACLSMKMRDELIAMLVK